MLAKERHQALQLILVVRREAICSPPNTISKTASYHKRNIKDKCGGNYDVHIVFSRHAVEPVRDEDLVLLVAIGDGEDVGALNSLVAVGKDVIHIDDTLGGIVGTSGVYADMD